MITKKEYEKLCKKANYFSEKYYNGNEKISDSKFDAMLTEIKEFEKTHKISKTSPTQKVGEDNEKGFKKVTHEYPMLSLAKVLSLRELKEWLCESENKIGISKYTLEYKMDGCGLALIYKKGKLVKAVTRGNGIRGDDVTANALTIEGVVEQLPKKIDIEIRGEVIFPKSEFNKAIKLGEELKNCRNTASGALKLHSPKEVAKRHLRFYAYTILKYENESQIEDVKMLKDFGFTTVCLFATKDKDKIISYCNKYADKRKKLDFDIDGMVIKINLKSKQKKMGMTSINPKYAIAYKFPNEVVNPEIKDVIWQIGKTGAITPVAIYEPMLLCGTTVERASLHNYKIIKELGIAVGDTVAVVKKGEIIPQVKELISKGKCRTKISFPNCCPCCGSKTKFIGEKLYCTNDKCKDRIVGQITSWCSKKNMNIDGVSEATVKSMLDNELICDVTDLYSLTRKDLLKLNGIKDKSANNILNAIKQSKKAGLSRVISGLGIDTIGNTIAEELAGKFKSLKNLICANEKELSDIDTIGQIKAHNIIKFFKKNKSLVNKLFHIDGMVLGEKESKKISSKLNGKSFCITGTLSVGRTEFQSRIKAYGGKPVSSISKNTEYLVAGIGGGSKLNKAEKLGVTVISESQFNKLIK